MKKNSFWEELLRRKVIRTGISYAVTAWLILQVLEIILPAFEAPAWVLKVMIAVLVLGLPVVLVLAWSFDIEPSSSSGQSGEGQAPRRAGVNVYLAVVLALAVGYILVDKFYLSESPRFEQDPVAAQPAQLAAKDKSIAILPFKNMSANGEDLYFSDGVMEAILNELSMIRDLKVVSRTSVESYRDTVKAIPQIARELGVAHILEGSVQRAGNQVRVTAQLIEAGEDKHLWSRNYDRSLDDIFAIQSEIATAISENLELILTSEEVEQLTNAPTSELRAYDLYLKAQSGKLGTHLADRPSEESREAKRSCEQARDLDPEFALAYTCIAENLFYLGKSEFIGLSEWRDPAMAHLEQALQLDPRQWQAYAVRSDIQAAMGEVQAATRDGQRVLEINPNQPAFLIKMGFYTLNAGEPERAIDMILRSLELIPGSALRAEAESVVSNIAWLAPGLAETLMKKYQIMQAPSIDMLHWLGAEALSQRNYWAYLDNMQVIAGRLPTPNNLINLGLAYIFNEDFERAKQTYERVMAMEGDPETLFLKYPFKHRYAYTLMKTGEEERGLEMMIEYRDELEQVLASGGHARGNKGEYYDLAVIYSTLGDVEQAKKWMREAFKHVSEGAFADEYFVRGDTMLANLRADPEVQKNINRSNDNIPRIQAMFREKLAQAQLEGRLLWLDEG